MMFYGRVARDIYTSQLKPEEIEFGHVCESPSDWEQRFEKINLAENSRKGKVFTTTKTNLITLSFR